MWVSRAITVTTRILIRLLVFWKRGIALKDCRNDVTGFFEDPVRMLIKINLRACHEASFSGENSEIFKYLFEAFLLRYCRYCSVYLGTEYSIISWGRSASKL